MLTITIPAIEFWNEAKQEFMSSKAQTLTLEHSLVSVSKWESKWKKPFLVKNDKTKEEIVDYIKCMTLTQNVPESAYDNLTEKNIKEITEYIEDPMTATWFNEGPGGSKKEGRSRKTITSEFIYYLMTAYNIPFECKKWHLNRLLVLIKICEEENAPKKKRSGRELLQNYSALNAERKKKLNTKG